MDQLLPQDLRTWIRRFIVGFILLPEDVQRFRSCGADAVLPKPSTMANLEDLLIEHGIIEATP